MGATLRGGNRVALERLQGGLVVSCQAPKESPLRWVLVTIAQSVVQAGATGLRLDGPKVVRACRKFHVPIIGIFKDGSITPTFAHAREVARAGAPIVATANLELIPKIRQDLKVEVLADVSTVNEGLRAVTIGADAVATTLSGYTPQSPRMKGPDLALVSKLARRLRTLAEGRYATPVQVRAAFRRGAWAVVVGTAITRPDELTRRFLAAL